MRGAGGRAAAADLPPPPPPEAGGRRRFAPLPVGSTSLLLCRLDCCAVELLADVFRVTAADANSSAGSTPALAVPEGGWLPCGRTTPCEDATACCAIWVRRGGSRD